MPDRDFDFAQRRFEHARQELLAVELSDDQRLLRALIALAPLPVGVLPPAVDRLYRDVQGRLGERFWRPGGRPGTLGEAIATLSRRECRRCIAILFEASLALERSRH